MTLLGGTGGEFEDRMLKFPVKAVGGRCVFRCSSSVTPRFFLKDFVTVSFKFKFLVPSCVPLAPSSHSLLSFCGPFTRAVSLRVPMLVSFVYVGWFYV